MSDEMRAMSEVEYKQHLEKQVAELEPYKTELVKIAEQLGEELDPFAAWEVLDHALRTLQASQREKELYKTAYDTVNGALICAASMADESVTKYCNNVIESVTNSVIAETIDLEPAEAAALRLDPLFEINSYVEKYIGEARWFGQVRSVYTTSKGKIRYVVEVMPQGFQMIAVANQLRAVPKESLPEYINVNKLAIDDALHHVEAEIFSRDEKIAHMAASPMTVEHKRHGVRENIMRYIRFWKNGE